MKCETDGNGTRPESIAAYYGHQGCNAIWQCPPLTTIESARDFLIDLHNIKESPGCNTQIVIDMLVFYPDEELRRSDPTFHHDQGHYVIFEGLKCNSHQPTHVVFNDPSTIPGFGGIRSMELCDFVNDWEDWHPDTGEHLRCRALLITPR